MKLAAAGCTTTPNKNFTSTTAVTNSQHSHCESQKKSAQSTHERPAKEAAVDEPEQKKMQDYEPVKYKTLRQKAQEKEHQAVADTR